MHYPNRKELKWNLDWNSKAHHWAVDGTDAVVAHVQCGQISPHRNKSCDWTTRLCTLRFPLWEFAWFRHQDRLKRHHDTRQYRTHVVQPTQEYYSKSCKVHHHSFCSAVDTHSRQTRPQRRQTLNLLRAAFTDLKTQKRKVTFPFFSEEFKRNLTTLETPTSICSRDLKTDRSKGRLLSWMLLVPTEPLVPEICATKTKPVRTFTTFVERKPVTVHRNQTDVKPWGIAADR